MIGCIGLAPASGVGSTFMPAYQWGGNMDLREMSPGTTVELPVEVACGLDTLTDEQPYRAALACTFGHHQHAARYDPTVDVGGEVCALDDLDALAEGAEAAACDADVGGVDVAVDVEIGLIAVYALADEVGEPADAEDVGGVEENEAVVE